MDWRFRWKLWFSDWTTFSDLQGEPNESPKWGLVAIVQPYERRRLVWNDTYYIYREDTGLWTSHDLIGFLDQNVHFSPQISCVRIGRSISDDDMDAIRKMAEQEVAVNG